MKRNSFLLLIFIFIMCGSFCYVNQKISIYMAEYDYSFTPQQTGCLDTFTKKVEDGRELKIVLFDCRGRMHLECFKNNKKIEEGDYINSLDILRKYITRVDGINGIQNIKVKEYYQPLRSGTWFFYDLKGKLLHKKIYKDGVLQK